MSQNCWDIEHWSILSSCWAVANHYTAEYQTLLRRSNLDRYHCCATTCYWVLSRQMRGMSYTDIKAHLTQYSQDPCCIKPNRNLSSTRTSTTCSKQPRVRRVQSRSQIVQNVFFISSFYESHCIFFLSLAHISLIINHHIVQKHTISNPYSPSLTTPFS